MSRSESEKEMTTAVTPEQLLERVNAALEKAKAIDGTPEKIQAIEKGQAELRSIIEGMAASLRAHSFSLPGAENEKKYDVGKATRAALTGNWKDAGLELDIHKQTFERLPTNAQQRVMTTLTPSAGGFLIPEEISTTMIEKLDPVSVVKKAGATIVKPSGWPFKVNKITGGTTAAYASEGSSVSASDITLGQVSLSPRKIGARSVLTMEQVQYGTPQTDAIVVNDLIKRTELIQDLWALTGSGQQGQPIGITNTTGINTTTGIKSGQLVFADLAIAMQYLEEDNVMTDKIALIAHPTQKGELFRNVNATVSSGTLANEGAAFIFGSPFITAAMFKTMTGIDIFPTTQMTDGTAIVGVFEWLWLAEFGGLVVSASDVASDGTHHAFTEDKRHLKVTRWIDSAVIQPVAFHAITSI